MAFDPADPAAAVLKAQTALRISDPLKAAEKEFNYWFRENVPVLETDNQDLLKVYYYRWFLAYRSIHRPSDWIADHPIPGQCVYESPYGRWFGSVVGLPIPWHISELRRMKKPALTREQLDHRPDRSFHCQPS